MSRKKDHKLIKEQETENEQVLDDDAQEEAVAEENEVPAEGPDAESLDNEEQEEGDVTMLLGLISQMQTAHEALEDQVEHLLEWAHRRGYRQE